MSIKSLTVITLRWNGYWDEINQRKIAEAKVQSHERGELTEEAADHLFWLKHG